MAADMGHSALSRSLWHGANCAHAISAATMRLELTRRGDYAIRAMLLLAQAPEVLTGADIARRTNIPERLVRQVLGQLVRAGLLQARLGRRGGYWLAQPRGAIPILAIVEAVEGDSRRERCVLSGAACDAANRCQVHDIFASAQEALISRLANASLESAVGRGSRRREAQDEPRPRKSRRGAWRDMPPPGRGAAGSASTGSS
jgi:Rrf2 family protein